MGYKISGFSLISLLTSLVISLSLLLLTIELTMKVQSRWTFKQKLMRLDMLTYKLGLKIHDDLFLSSIVLSSFRLNQKAKDQFTLELMNQLKTIYFSENKLSYYRIKNIDKTIIAERFVWQIKIKSGELLLCKEEVDLNLSLGLAFDCQNRNYQQLDTKHYHLKAWSIILVTDDSAQYYQLTFKLGLKNKHLNSLLENKHYEIFFPANYLVIGL